MEAGPGALTLVVRGVVLGLGHVCTWRTKGEIRARPTSAALIWKDLKWEARMRRQHRRLASSASTRLDSLCTNRRQSPPLTQDGAPIPTPAPSPARDARLRSLPNAPSPLAMHSLRTQGHHPCPAASAPHSHAASLPVLPKAAPHRSPGVADGLGYRAAATHPSPRLRSAWDRKRKRKAAAHHGK